MSGTAMHWRHRQALERFARATQPLDYPATRGMGKATWKTLIENGWIEPIPESKGTWWQRKHLITEAGRTALGVDSHG
jgi:hypothetical protein